MKFEVFLAPSLVLIPAFLLLGTGFSTYLPCVQKDFGHGSIVCVCNDTYCDEFVDEEPSLLAGHYVVYTSTKDGQRFNESVNEVKREAINDQVDVKLQINASAHFQTIFGFGGAFTGKFFLFLQHLQFLEI